MIFRRHRINAFVAAAAVLTAGLACGDSDETPLGSQFIGDPLGSVPGTVFEDSFSVAGGDTSVAFFSMIDGQAYLEVGQDNGYQRSALLRPDFSSAGSDTLRTVDEAFLRLLKIETEVYTDGVSARFYELGTAYNEGDSIGVLDTTFVIPDTLGALDRELTLFPPTYDLPPDLVQSWIRGEVPANGIAIVYVGDSEELFGFYSRTGDDPPTVRVNFTDGSQSSYPIVADGIYTRPTETTSDLVISDGFVRRIHLPVDLSQVDDSAAVHQARLVFTYVPGSVFGANQNVILYVPNATDPTSPDFARGQLITEETLDESSGVLELPITNVLLGFLSGELDNNGFALRFRSETTEVRQAEFYTSADPDNGPKVFVIYSTPAEFRD